MWVVFNLRTFVLLVLILSNCEDNVYFFPFGDNRSIFVRTSEIKILL